MRPLPAGILQHTTRRSALPSVRRPFVQRACPSLGATWTRNAYCRYMLRRSDRQRHRNYSHFYKVVCRSVENWLHGDKSIVSPEKSIAIDSLPLWMASQTEMPVRRSKERQSIHRPVFCCINWTYNTVYAYKCIRNKGKIFNINWELSELL